MHRLLMSMAPVYTILIIYLSLGKSHAPALNIDQIDKFYHCVAYLGVSLLWYLFFYLKYYKVTDQDQAFWIIIGSNIKPRLVVVAVLIGIALGVLLEIGQGYLSTNRTMDAADAIANTIGTIIAALVIWVVFKIFNTQSLKSNHK